jgi:thymidine phosphorylase
MVQMSGLQQNYQVPLAAVEKVLYSGVAANIFGRMIKVLGGPTDFLECVTDYLPQTPLIIPVLASYGHITVLV